MSTPVLNREFKHPADGWYHIEPKGEHANPGAGVIQVIDEEAIQSIVSRFNADATAGNLSHGTEMLIDHEHFKHDRDKETRAYGWLQQLQTRADGIYGRVRWTSTGKEAVDGGDYRFFSSEYDPKETKYLNEDEGRAGSPAPEARRLRPLRLEGLTLTNQPNNRGQRPITNRNSGIETDDFADAVASAPNQPTTQPKHNPRQQMKDIAIKLGLAAEAGEPAILAEITRIQNRNSTLEPLDAENKTLKNRIQQIDAEAVAGLLAELAITDEKLVNRLRPVLANYATRAERLAFMDDCGFSGQTATGNKPEAKQTKLFNRHTKPPQAGKADELPGAKADQAGVTKIMNRAQEIKKATPNVTDATAVIMAQREMEQVA